MRRCPGSRPRLPFLTPLLLLAALAIGCETRPPAPTVVTAMVTDSAAAPLPGSHAEIRLPNDTVLAQAVADSAGRVRLELDHTGPVRATFAPSPDAAPAEWVSAPLLVESDPVDLEIRLGGDGAGVRYPDPGPRGARWGRAVALNHEIQRRHNDAYEAWVAAGQEGQLETGITPLVDSVLALLADEEDPDVRTALWVGRIMTPSDQAPLSSDSAELALEELDPGARIWQFEPPLAAGVALNASYFAEAVQGASGQEASQRQELAHRRTAAFLGRVLEAQTDPAVRPGVLLGGLQIANLTSRTEEATEYYRRLREEYPESIEARQAEEMKPLRALAVGDPVPDIALPALDSTAAPISPDELVGPATLVDFWAVWCTPCVAELPTLRAARERFGDRGFRIVSVSYDESRDDVRDFRRDHPMPWRHAFVGAPALAGGRVTRAYGVMGLPHTVLVGPEGTVLATGAELRGELLAWTLERVLGSGS